MAGCSIHLDFLQQQQQRKEHEHARDDEDDFVVGSILGEALCVGVVEWNEKHEVDHNRTSRSNEEVNGPSPCVDLVSDGKAG